MKKKVSFLLAVTLLLGTGMFNWNHVEAESIDDVKKDINQMEEEKKELNDKQGNVDGKKSDTEKKIKENLSKQDNVKTDIQTIDQQLNETKSKIKSKENLIAKTNEEIKQLKKDIDVLKKRIKKREKLLKERLRAIQQNGGDMRYIEVIFGAQNFSDFISRSSAVNTIMDQDKNIMETQAAEKKELENKKREVEDKKEAIEESKQELESLKAQLNDQIAEKEKLMEQLEEQHADLEEYKMSLAEEQEMLRKQEAALNKAMKLAEQQKQELEQLAKEQAARQAQANSGSTASSSGPVITGGDFIKPISGISVSSNFGWRTHPVTGQRSFHGGVDLVAPVGTPIYASASGVAMTGNLDGSYGNHVLVVSIIDGVKYTTLYAHMSSFAVGNGQAVQQGDVIGYVGLTGRTTGAHLHFELHKGGWIGYHPPNSNAVNPISYIQ
ncbi:murein hydrolase activator EnvC family protein [Virgibacillus oceani]|uniref:Peptidase M24 n=1 Tax=Virgibacillus oceani TaxID=1479511 RepID=A0A917LZD6_9BACI|nr:peptidoglycan DD-metalloendopeptidase family protein [Virgibacillus oceani]GGG67277.1 peptidase M24 [Virgibacillus oceani]